MFEGAPGGDEFAVGEYGSGGGAVDALLGGGVQIRLMADQRSDGQPAQTCGNEGFGALIKHVNAVAVKSGKQTAAINNQAYYTSRRPVGIDWKRLEEILPSRFRFVPTGKAV